MAPLGNFYLRPPKRQTNASNGKDNMLSLARKAILHEYTMHAMTEHDYPTDRGAAMQVFACSLCELMIKRLHESEHWTEENYEFC